MRVAFSGTHRVGKSTLLEGVASALPDHVTVDEPYLLLEEDGYEPSDPPSPEDFEAQLERSLLSVEESGPNVLFDRCPADVIAYLLVTDADVDEWLARARAAMQTLDLVVYVPIETSDRVAIAAHEDRAYRIAVDEKLRSLLRDDAIESGTEVIEVHGDVQARVDQVMNRINNH